MIIDGILTWRKDFDDCRSVLHLALPVAITDEAPFCHHRRLREGQVLAGGHLDHVLSLLKFLRIHYLCSISRGFLATIFCSFHSHFSLYICKLDWQDFLYLVVKAGIVQGLLAPAAGEGGLPPHKDVLHDQEGSEHLRFN